MRPSPFLPLSFPFRTWLRRMSAWFGLLLAIFAVAPAAFAQVGDWPNRPVRIVVPAAPGGAYDKAIRPLAQELSTQFKQQFVVDNRPGAGNIPGTNVGAKSPADGYTLTMTGMMNTIAAGMYENVPFDILGDFVHIGGIVGGGQWLVVRADTGLTSLADLLARAKREPGKLNYATSGAGSTAHLLMELLQRATGTSLTHVPYKSGAPALQDTLAGVVPIVVVPAAAVEQHVKAGKLRVLASSAPARESQYPEVPTFAELGYKNLTVSSWAGLSAPKGTPPEVVRKLQAAMLASLARQQIVDVYRSEGMTAMPMTSEEYTQLMRNDFERWGQLTRALGLKAQ
jgi:tripartite-type tricarboxylate transporter receptor subunit TctC